MGNPRFGVHFHQVKNHHSGGFAAGSGCRGNSIKRLKLAGHRPGLADGCIHVIKEIGRVRGVEIGCLGRIH